MFAVFGVSVMRLLWILCVFLKILHRVLQHEHFKYYKVNNFPEHKTITQPMIKYFQKYIIELQHMLFFWLLPPTAPSQCTRAVSFPHCQHVVTSWVRPLEHTCAMVWKQSDGVCLRLYASRRNSGCMMTGGQSEGMKNWTSEHLW